MDDRPTPYEGDLPGAGRRLVAAAALLLVAALPAPALASSVSEVAVSRGVLALDGGALAEALGHFDRAVAADPTDARAHHLRGHTLARLDRDEEAREALAEAVRLDPAAVDARYELGVVLYELGEEDGALAELDAVRAAEPDRAMAHYYAGLVHHGRGDYDLSPALFARARELAPALAPVSHYYAGIAHFRRQEGDRARADLERVLDLDPGSPVAGSARAFLDALERGAPGDAAAAKRWSVDLATTVDYDDNVVLRADDQDLDDLGISDEADVRHTLYARGVVVPWAGEATRTGLHYSFYRSLHHDLADYDLQAHQAGAYAAHRLGDWEPRLDYRFDHTSLGGDTFLVQHVVTASATRTWSERSLTRFAYAFTPVDRFDNDERDGHQHAAELGQYLVAGEAGHLLRAGYRWERELTDGDRAEGTDDFDYTGHELTVAAELVGPWELTADLGARYRIRNYDEVDSRFDEGEKRQEWQRGVWAGLRRPVCDVVSVGVRYAGTFNRSNLDAFEYDRHAVSLSLAARF